MKNDSSAYKNVAFRGAYTRGWAAGYDGLPLTDIPYENKLNSTGKVTFSRGLIKAWKRGHKHGLEGKAEVSLNPDLTVAPPPSEVMPPPKKLRRRSIIKRD